MAPAAVVCRVAFVAALLLAVFFDSCDPAGQNIRARHSAFVKSQLRSRSPHAGYTWCAGNSSACSDPASGGSPSATCCWNRFCKDTSKDSRHCGKCGNACQYGLTCCQGRCVNLKTNKKHCGACHKRCHHKCSFGMCNYASADYTDDDQLLHSSHGSLKHPLINNHLP